MNAIQYQKNADNIVILMLISVMRSLTSAKDSAKKMLFQALFFALRKKLFLPVVI